jgi:hypothetical protein
MRLAVSVGLPKIARYLPGCCLSSAIASAALPLTRVAFGGVERAREHDLGNAVHPVGDGRVAFECGRGRPVARHALVRRPSEQQRVDVVELADGKLVELVVDVRPVELSVGPLVVAVEGHHHEREELPHLIRPPDPGFVPSRETSERTLPSRRPPTGPRSAAVRRCRRR